MSDLPTDSLLRQESSAADASLSLGDTLRGVRESRGLALSDVSARIKYSAVQLGYLESGQWSRLPGGVPLRGLVRNYARFLDLDVDLMLQLLDDAVGPTKPMASVTALGARVSLQQPDTPTNGEPAHRTWAWLLLILVLFVLVGLYAINRGWVPDEWLVFEWLRSFRP